MLIGILAAALGSAEHPAAMAALPLDSPCPIPTPELFLVDPVTSPTGQFTQAVTVRLGNGEAVTITAESGTFATHGDYDAYSHPATVTVALLTDTVHHLHVFGKVKVVEHDGCVYGGYTLYTDKDRFDAPLTIWQHTYLTHRFHLPLVFRNVVESR
jgi:hypothetical protein